MLVYVYYKNKQMGIISTNVPLREEPENFDVIGLEFEGTPTEEEIEQIFYEYLDE
jgi:hypothetical protein